MLKTKVHRTNSQTMSSYPVRFSTDIFFSSLVSFAYISCYICCILFLKLKICSLIHIRLCGRVSDKKIFTRPISANKTTFFLALSVIFQRKMKSICKVLENSSSLICLGQFCSYSDQDCIFIGSDIIDHQLRIGMGCNQ